MSGSGVGFGVAVLRWGAITSVLTWCLVCCEGLGGTARALVGASACGAASVVGRGGAGGGVGLVCCLLRFVGSQSSHSTKPQRMMPLAGSRMVGASSRCDDVILAARSAPGAISGK